MIAIITRCRNRLEYTIKTVFAVQNTIGQYKHIIIDNNSSDGTKQWFSWMSKNTSALKNIYYYRYDQNLGDWGGMLAAREYTQDCDYVVQLDNDILIPENWLEALKFTLDNTHYKVMMLRRENVLWKLKPIGRVVNIGGYQVGRVERPVACYMMSKMFYDKCCEAIPARKGMRSKYMIAQLSNRSIGKIMNVTCSEIDSLTQRKLYNPRNPEVWEKI